MSNKKPVCIKIATKKSSSIKDVLIAPNYPNCLVKVLELKGMTNAIIRSDGTLDQKFVLYFDDIVTCCKFTKTRPYKMILGTSSGQVIIYDNAPHKSLLEDYHKIYNSISRSKVVDILPHSDNNEILIVHSSGQQFHEFVNWKYEKSSSTYSSTGNFSVLALKKFCPIYANGRIVKIAHITGSGQVSISDINTGTTVDVTKVSSIQLQTATLLQISNSNWFILAVENRILVCCHETGKLLNSFALPSVKEFVIVKEIACNSKIFELFVYTSSKLLRLKIDPNVDVVEFIQFDLIDTSDQLYSIHVTPSYFILVTNGGIFIHDSLNLERINKCSYPKFSLKYLNSENVDDDDVDDSGEPVRIEEFDDNKFLFLWRNSLAQIWDFAPTSKQSDRGPSKKSPEIDKATVGGKAIRKYSKYAVNSGYSEWKDEKREEDHLDSLRDRLNIDGLTEEELVAYATLISKEANGNNNTEIVDIEDVSDDPDLQLALQLSLVDM